MGKILKESPPKIEKEFKTRILYKGKWWIRGDLVKSDESPPNVQNSHPVMACDQCHESFPANTMVPNPLGVMCKSCDGKGGSQSKMEGKTMICDRIRMCSILTRIREKDEEIGRLNYQVKTELENLQWYIDKHHEIKSLVNELDDWFNQFDESPPMEKWDALKAMVEQKDVGKIKRLQSEDEMFAEMEAVRKIKEGNHDVGDET